MERSHTDADWRLVDSPGAFEQSAIAFMRRFKTILISLVSLVVLLLVACQIPSSTTTQRWVKLPKLLKEAV